MAVDVADRSRLIAVARCVRTDPETAEMAIVVGDPWQGLGLGRALSAQLAQAARAVGIKRISGTMLADNRPALRLMKGFGTPSTTTRCRTASARSSRVWPPDGSRPILLKGPCAAPDAS